MSDADSEHTEANPDPALDMAAIAQRISDGDKLAETQLVRAYERQLLFIVQRKFFDASFVPDVVQDAFILAIMKLRTREINNPNAIKSFLRTSAINIGYNYLKKEKRELVDVDTDKVEISIDTNGDTFSLVSHEQLVTLVRRLIAELKTPRDTEILTRFYFLGEDKSDVCKHLGLSATHFDRVLYRARQRLHELLPSDSVCRATKKSIRTVSVFFLIWFGRQVR